MITSSQNYDIYWLFDALISTIVNSIVDKLGLEWVNIYHKKQTRRYFLTLKSQIDKLVTYSIAAKKRPKCSIYAFAENSNFNSLRLEKYLQLNFWVKKCIFFRYLILFYGVYGIIQHWFRSWFALTPTTRGLLIECLYMSIELWLIYLWFQLSLLIIHICEDLPNYQYSVWNTYI